MAYKQKHPYLADIWYMVKWKLTHLRRKKHGNKTCDTQTGKHIH